MATGSDIESVTCELCAQLYTDPSMLPCLHSFCKKCLLKLTANEQGNNLTCPSNNCDEISSASSLLPNRYLARKVEELGTTPTPCEGPCATSVSAKVFCRTCTKFLCAACRDQHKVSHETKEHVLTQLLSDAREKERSNVAKRPLQCPILEHGLLNYFCLNCRVLVCSDCLLLNHNGHSYDKVSGRLSDKCCADVRNSVSGRLRLLTMPYLYQ